LKNVGIFGIKEYEKIVSVFFLFFISLLFLRIFPVYL